MQAHAQAKSALDRMQEAESGLKDAADSVEKNFGFKPRAVTAHLAAHGLN